jgi:hypothetical protein
MQENKVFPVLTFVANDLHCLVYFLLSASSPLSGLVQGDKQEPRARVSSARVCSSTFSFHFDAGPEGLQWK